MFFLYLIIIPITCYACNHTETEVEKVILIYFLLDIIPENNLTLLHVETRLEWKILIECAEYTPYSVK